MTKETCHFPGCSNEGEHRTYDGPCGSTKLTKDPWCEAHKNGSLRDAARAARKDALLRAKLEAAGAKEGEIFIDEWSGPRMSQQDLARRSQNGKHWLTTEDKVERYRILARAEAKERAARESARWAKEEEERQQRIANRRKAQRPKSKTEERAPKRQPRPELAPSVLVTSYRVTPEEIGEIPSPGPGFVPWGSPVMALVDGTPFMTQAWRERVADPPDPPKGGKAPPDPPGDTGDLASILDTPGWCDAYR